jgi:hypothetical protein
VPRFQLHSNTAVHRLCQTARNTVATKAPHHYPRAPSTAGTKTHHHCPDHNTVGTKARRPCPPARNTAATRVRHPVATKARRRGVTSGNRPCVPPGT